MLDSQEILAVSDQAEIFRRLSDAIEVLANKGDWNPNIGYVDICALSDGKTITLPRDIDTPLAVNVGGRPQIFRNRWHEFHINGAGSFAETPWNWDDQGDFPVAMDIINASNLIAVADLKNDLNIVLRIFGFDQSGKWIRTQAVNGTWEDGFLPPINIISDFPNGIIVPDATRRFIRNFSTGVMDSIYSVAHRLVTGEPVTLALVSAPLPAPLVSGNHYFVRAIDADHVSLHATQSQALTGGSPIVITSGSNASQVSLTDTRQVTVLTQFTTATAHNMQTGMLIDFTAVTLPTPIVVSTNYYARVIDSLNFTAHSTADDALSNTNPIDVSDVGNTVVVHAKQDFDPITLFQFSTNHNFLQGDIVRAQNTTGVFPDPLLPGVNYYVHFISATSITLHSNLDDSTTGFNPIVLFSAGGGSTSLYKTISASAVTGSSNQITAPGHNLTITTLSPAVTTASRARSSNVSTIVCGSAHGLATGDYVVISGVGGTDYNTTKTLVTILSPKIFTYSNIGGNEAVTADVAGSITKIPSTGDFVQFSTNGQFPNPIAQNTTYRAEPAMSADSFTLYTASADTVNITTNGTGQLFLIVSRTIQIGFTDTWKTNATKFATADPIKVAATLSLPTTSPALSTATTYFLRKIDDSTVELYDTSARSSDTAARISATRARSSNVATIVTNAAHGLLTNDYVNISGVATLLNGVLADTTIGAGGTLYVQGQTAAITDGTGHTASGTVNVTAGAITSINITNGGNGFTVAGALTVTTGTSADATVTVAAVTNSVASKSSTYDGKRKQITKINATTFTFASVGLNEPTTVDVGGTILVSPIQVLSIGAGAIELVLERSVTPTVFSGLLPLSSNTFLSEGAAITFTTDGTLPAPLAVLTTYYLSLSGGLLQVKNGLGVAIPITGVGSGLHNMVLARTFNVVLPTYVDVPLNEYSKGDAVTLETTGALPAPLAVSTTYYLRRLSDTQIELYDTKAHAINTASTTGRITPTNTGTGTQTFVQTVDNILVQKVTRVSKSASNGFLSLYAWDTGRETNLTILGNYYPDEVEPSYRRIKIGTNCSWVRMRYRKRAFQITSLQDWIPLRSKQSIVFMLKALKQYRDEFNELGKDYEELALHFLEEDEQSNMGPDSPTIQINAPIFTNPGAMGMDPGHGYLSW